MPTVIDRDAQLVTLINVFTVPRGRQGELVELLERATEDVMRHQPGFISANIHAGLDGTHVANYAQWRTEQDFHAMLANPECQIHMAAARDMANAEPVLYQVASTH